MNRCPTRFPAPRSRPHRLALLSVIVFGWALGSCSSSGSGDQILAQQTVGDAGATLVVTSGPNQGLTLTIPPGALDGPVAVRIVDNPPDPLPPGVAIGGPPPVGVPFRIEPEALDLNLPAQLEVPYFPARAVGPPGHVALNRARGNANLSIDPVLVDVAAGRVTAEVEGFGAFLVNAVQLPTDVSEYLPDEGVVQEFDGGWSFSIGPIDISSPFGGQGYRSLSVRGPNFAEDVIVAGNVVVGRQRPGVWVERWQQPAEFVLAAFGSQLVTQNSALDVLINGGPSLSGTMEFGGYFDWGQPRFVGPTQYRNILEISANFSFVWDGMPAANRALTFWLEPDAGVLAMRVDGKLIERLP